MKVIFLDFDFVLNSRNSFAWHTLTGKMYLASPDKYSVLLIDYLLFNIPDLNIVISSSWRSAKGHEESKLYLKNDFGLLHFDRVIGQTPFDSKRFRGREVESWLENTTFEIDKYVIIDDDTDFFTRQKPFFVKTDEDGFRPKHLEQCCKILNFNTENLYSEKTVTEFRQFLEANNYVY